MPAAASTLQPTLPAEVIAFAAEKGAADYLPAVLEMTRRIFPTGIIKVTLEEDAEIADWRTIVFETDVTDWEVDPIVAAQQEWTASIFQVCPATHVHLFIVMPWASA